jgi:N-acetylglucosamine-6-phosphate deacetylase
MQHVLTNCSIYTGEAIIPNGAILIENGAVVSVSPAAPQASEIPEGCQTVNLNGMNIAPGFIDIQLNGGEQFNFTASPTEETIDDMYQSCLRTGTTHLLPCMISSSKENILKGIEAIKNYRSKYDNSVIGMHLEGPFINVQKRGAHLPAHIRKPSNNELSEIIREGKDVIKLITIAPECFTDDQLDMLLSSGIVVSAGHSNMTYRQAQDHFGKGIKLVTHLFNAMAPFGHREPGLTGAALENDEVFTPVILDGVHCDYGAARLAYKLKNDKLILISDALFLGRKKKEFNWGNFRAALVDGFYRNPEGNLAGATISMAEAVRNAHIHLAIPVAEAIKMATSRVAAAIGMEHHIGSIAPGFPASFVLFDDNLDQMETVVF